MVSCANGPKRIITPTLIPASQPHIPQMPTNPEGEVMTALLFGKLVSQDGCLRIRVEGTDESYLVLWPSGTKWDAGENGVLVKLKSYTVIVRVGEILKLSGGEIPSVAEKQFRELHSDIDSRCLGPYWILGKEIGPK